MNSNLIKVECLPVLYLFLHHACLALVIDERIKICTKSQDGLINFPQAGVASCNLHVRVDLREDTGLELVASVRRSHCDRGGA